MVTPTKRTHERYDVNIQVVVQHEGRHIECTSKNVSVGGMFVLCPESVKFGDAVTLLFRLPALSEPSTVQARVRWVTDEGFGVQFSSLRAIEVWGVHQLHRGAS